MYPSRFVFRGLNHTPRKFKLRSRHYDPKKRQWEKNKKYIEYQVKKEKGELSDDDREGMMEISFRSNRREREQRIAQSRQRNKSRSYTLVFLLISLSYLAYRFLEKFNAGGINL